MANQDFRDLFAAFNGAGVEYLVVGAHALAAHGHVRATKDLDVWVRPTAPNAHRVLSALQVFGAPLHGLRVADLIDEQTVFRLVSIQCASIFSVGSMAWVSRWRGPIGF